MATMAYQVSGFDPKLVFGAAEDSVSFVEKSLCYAKKLNVIFRTIAKLTTLTVAFEEAAKKQGALVDALNGPASHNFTSEKYLNLAKEIEHLVSLNDSLLKQVSCYKFAPWKESMNTITAQRDTLESIAESFRIAADVECESLLALALETVGI